MKRLVGEKRGSLGEPFEKGIRIFSLMFPGNISCLFYFDSPGSKVSIINFDFDFRGIKVYSNYLLIKLPFFLPYYITFIN